MDSANKIFNYPICPFIVDQEFGENKACYNPFTKKVVIKENGVCPAYSFDLYVSSGMKGHNGLDSRAYVGKVLRHVGPKGLVTRIEHDRNKGLLVEVITFATFDWGDGKDYLKIGYCHLDSILVQVGDEVGGNTILGKCGNTGASSSPHLHLEVKPVDNNSYGEWYNVVQDNGFNGAIDPRPFFNGKYAPGAFSLLEFIKSYLPW